MVSDDLLDPLSLARRVALRLQAAVGPVPAGMYTLEVVDVGYSDNLVPEEARRALVVHARIVSGISGRGRSVYDWFLLEPASPAPEWSSAGLQRTRAFFVACGFVLDDEVPEAAFTGKRFRAELVVQADVGEAANRIWHTELL